jgi:mono/diheme cytochrome c family protein
MRRALIGLALLAFATGAAAADYQDYGGAELYQRFCASCHGKDGRGGGPVAGALKGETPDLTRIAVRHQGRYPENWVYRVIDGREYLMAHGPRDMPVWGVELWREQGADVDAAAKTRDLIARLVEYLRSLQEARTPESVGR